MDFYSRFWNWLNSHAAEKPRPHFDHFARLGLRKLENRRVFAVSAMATVATGVLNVSIDTGSPPSGYTVVDPTSVNATITVANDGTHDVLINGKTFSLGGGNVLQAGEVTAISVHDNTSVSTSINLSAVSAANGFTHSLNGLVSIVSGSGNDTITGSAFANVVTVGTGNDIIRGGGGNDTYHFSSSFGTDVIQNLGGSANTLDLSSVTSNLAVNLQSQSVTVPGNTSESISFAHTNFGTILGNSAASDSFQGLDATSSWVFNSAGGTYTSPKSLTTVPTTNIGFSGFQSVIGGAGDNTFQFSGSPGTTLTSLTTSTSGTSYLNGGILNATNVNFHDAVIVESTTTINATQVLFQSTVDASTLSTSPAALNVNASTSAEFDAAVGGTTPLGSLDEGGSGLTTLFGSVTTKGTQTYSGAVVLAADDTLTTTNSNVTFGSTIDGNHNLIVADGSGTVTFNGAVGGKTALSSLSVDGNGTTVINTANINTNGNQVYQNAVQVEADTVLNSNSAGAITFDSTVDSTSGQNHALTINTAGLVTLDGSIGNTSPLSSLTIGGGGTVDINTASISTTGNQTYNDAAQLFVDTSLNSSSSGAITFNSTLDSSSHANKLSVNTAGTITFEGTVGGTALLYSLTTGGGGITDINAPSVNTTENQTYNEAVQLSVNTTLNSTAAAAISFANTVDSAPGKTNSLTVNTAGTVTFNGAVGATDQLSSLTTEGGGTTVISAATVNTTGAQNYDEAVQIGVATVMKSSSSGNITFNSALDSTPGQTNALSVQTAGTVTFDGTVGGTDRLSSLTTGGGGTTVINTANVSTTNGQTYNDAVQLEINTTLASSSSGDITFGGALDSTSGKTNSLIVNTAGTVSFDGTVGGTNQLSILTVEGGGTTVINAANVYTTLNQNYDGAVILAANTTLTSNASGSVTFSSTLDSKSGQTNGLTVNTAGTVTVDGVVGGTNQLSNLTFEGGGTTVINTTHVNTTGNQNYDEAVQVGIGTVLKSSAAGDITFNSTLDSTVGRTNAVSVQSAGIVTFYGAVGGTDRLSSLTTGGGGTTDINAPSVNTTGAQNYNEAVQLSINTTLNSSASGNIDFTTTVDSTSGKTNSLTVNTAGTVTFNGTVGGTDQLSSLTTEGGGTTIINSANINTTGGQNYNEAVQVGADTTLHSSAAGNIAFSSTLNSTPGQTNALTINTAGTVTFDGTVGGTDQLASLTTEGSGTTIINTSNVNTTGNQTYSQAVQLNVDTTLKSSASGDVTFSSTLDSTSGHTNSLTISSAGTTKFEGAVGGGNKLSSLTTEGGGTTDINGPSVNTTGAQNYNEAVVLSADTTLNTSNSGSITFSNTLDSSPSQTNSLTINTAGTVTFDGTVGGTDQLSDLTVNGSGTTVINAANVNTTGSQTYNQAVQLNVDTTLKSSASGDVTFTSTLDSTPGHTNSLTVNSAGTTKFEGTVGGGNKLSSLTTEGGGTTDINGPSVNTTGAQNYNEAVELSVNTALNTSNSGSITFSNTLDSSPSQTNSLTINTAGTVTFDGAVGGTDQLSGLTVNGNGKTVINTTSINTTGGQTYNQAVQLNVDTTLKSSASGDVTFSSSLDSTPGQSHSLTVSSAGTTKFEGTVGGTDKLSSLTTGGGGTTDINGPSVNTMGAQNYDEAVLLSINTTLNSSSGGDVTFNNSVDSTPGQTNSLTVNTAGTVTFDGTLGGTDQLSSLTTEGGGATVINTTNIETTGNQTYHDAVQVGVGSTLTSSAGGAITFDSTLDSTPGQTNALSISTSGNITFDGIVGGIVRLSSLTTGGGGTTDINTANINTTGDQSYKEAVVLAVSTTLDTSASGDITVNGTIDGTSAFAQNLTLSATPSGNIHVTGNIGATTSLGNLVITKANNTNFDGSVTANSFQQLGTTAGGTTTFGDGIGNDAVNTYGTIPGSTDGFQFTGHALVFASGSSSLDTHGEDVTITADVLTLPTTFVNAIGKTVTIQTLTDSTSIGLEDASQDLDFTNAQLNVIYSTNVVIGQSTNTGGIKIGTDGSVIVGANYTLDTAANLDVNGLFQLTGSNSLIANIGHDVTVSSSGKILTDSGNLTLNVGDDVTQSGTIETTSGNTLIDAGGQVTMTSSAQTLSTSGNVTITAGTTKTAGDDAITMSSGSVINPGSGQVDLTAFGNVTLGQVTTTNGTADAISTTSQTGGIINGNNPGITNIVDDSANSLVTLTAVTGVGSSTAISTNITNLAVFNASNLGVPASGNVQINDVNPNGFAIKQIEQAGPGNVVATSQATMTVTDPTAGGAGIQSTTGAISLTALNSTSNVDIQSSIESSGGNISIKADDGIILGSPGNGTTGQVGSSGGNISLVADNSGGTSGSIDMIDGSAINSGTGTVSLQAQGDIILSHIVSTNDTSSAVSLISHAGSLVNGGTSAGYNIEADQPGALTTIVTSTSIGTDSTYVSNPAIQTNIYEVNISNGPGGVGNTDINLNNASGLIIQQLTQNLPGAVNVTANGELEVLSTGSGVTSTIGPINLTATGSGGVVDLEGQVKTTGSAVTIKSDQDFLMGPSSTISTSGGNITITAGAGTTFSNQLGGITMSHGSTILGGGGTVQLDAQQDITLAEIISDTSPATLVSIVSQHGGIISGGQTGINDVTAGSLVLEAATGIGSAAPLQINVTTVASLNSGSGNLELNNTSGAPLVLGTVGGIAGLINVGPVSGDIDVTNQASILVDTPVTNSSGGSINMQALGEASDIEIDSQMVASGGNGGINLVAGHDIHLINIGSIPNLEVQGDGFVTLTAQNQVIFDPNVQIQSGTGSIIDAPPLLTNVVTPELTAGGEATVSGDFGRTGESNFTVTVNWDDGTIDTFYYPNASGPQTFTYTHIYHGNPNAADPSAPIPITVQVNQDPHIIVVAGALNLDSTSTTSNVALPGIGNSVFAYNTTPTTVFLTFPEPDKIVEIVHQAATQITDNSNIRIEVSRFDDTISSERRIFFEILSPDGKVLQRVDMPESVLDDMQAVISRLPDGNYRFQLQEPGELRDRLLLEFQVRQGKIFDGLDRSNRLPSSFNLKQQFLNDDHETPADALQPNNAEDLTSLEFPVDSTSIAAVLTPEINHREIEDFVATSQESSWNRWNSLSARRAWKRAEQIAASDSNHSIRDNLALSEIDDSSNETWEFTSANTAVMFVSATTLFTQVSSASVRKSVQKTAARLGRAARLFRKIPIQPR